MADRRCYEVAWYHHCSLVNQLVEGMLAIGAGLSPDDRAGAIGNRLAFTVNALAIAFHITLLKIGGKAMHVLIIRQNGFSLGTKKIGVPQTYQCHDNGNILVGWCGTKMM